MSVRTSRLSNGLTVVSDRMETVETATIGLWVDAGTRDETPEINGVAHLLEHMAFKGTARRSARDIAEQIESVGGHLNAHTGREYTAYYASVLKEDVELALDIIADIVMNSVFDEAELTRERAVVLQEIGEAADTPDDAVFDNFQEAAFPGQPLGWPVLGTEDRIRAMPRAALVDYMATRYAARRMVLAAAGKVDHDAIVAQAERVLAGLGHDGPPARAPASYGGGESREARELEQVHLVLGLHGMGFHDADLYAASVTSTALGGGMSSRLFQEVRERRGLAYSVYSFTSVYGDDGLFGIYAGTGEHEVQELIPVLCEEVAKLGAEVTEMELSRARAQLKASQLMSLESSYARCEQVARHMMVFGRVIPIEEIVGRIAAVDADGVRRVIGRLLAGRPTVAALGPIGSLEPYDTIAARLIG